MGIECAVSSGMDWLLARVRSGGRVSPPRRAVCWSAPSRETGLKSGATRRRSSFWGEVDPRKTRAARGASAEAIP
ncbi:MAG: hypothetical protein DMF53_19915 [Acidobacteria bacterium]|nr:MAG: hypothetical protein DMF53_19915 [Acidobacteriota bacterium]